MLIHVSSVKNPCHFTMSNVERGERITLDENHIETSYVYIIDEENRR